MTPRLRRCPRSARRSPRLSIPLRSRTTRSRRSRSSGVDACGRSSVRTMTWRPGSQRSRPGAAQGSCRCRGRLGRSSRSRVARSSPRPARFRARSSSTAPNNPFGPISSTPCSLACARSCCASRNWSTSSAIGSSVSVTVDPSRQAFARSVRPTRIHRYSDSLSDRCHQRHSLMRLAGWML